jgi:hypothetical protein
MAQGTKAVQQVGQFPQADVSAYLLADPGSRPKLGKWGVVAVVTGAILAVGIVAFETYFATLF